MGNRILRIDLESGRVTSEPVAESLRRQYLGGEGINARLLWEHFLKVPPCTDPLSPDNVLVIGAGPLSATSFGAGSKMKFTYKSPAYGIFGDTSSGGGLGTELRWAGYDHVVITGRSQHPVYLYIEDDRVEIRDARSIWNSNVSEADAAIKEELGDDRVEVACIGQAGANLVRVASIMVSCHRAGGRGGGGCVMGSKNLKGVAARGSRGFAIHDPPRFFQAMDDFRSAWDTRRNHRERSMRYGTLVATRHHQGKGLNTYRNGQGFEMPDDAVDKLDHKWYRDNLAVRATACSPGCAYACNQFHNIRGTESPSAAAFAGEWAPRPEFGGSNPFGASCDLRDMPAVAHLNRLCNEYGMDTMEIGMGISFLMELWEREAIKPADLREWCGGENISLDWGNFDGMVRLVEAAALQSNDLGRLLQRGVYRMAVMIAERTGVDVLRYANYGKAGATHEGPARSWPRVGMCCAVSSVGAHHSKGLGVNTPTSLQYFGTPDAGEPFVTTLVGAGYGLSEIFAAVSNSLGVCVRLVGREPQTITNQLIVRALEAATGIVSTPEGLMLAGERIINIQKAFNSRLGLRREDDVLCHRWMEEPQVEGESRGMKASNFLEAAKDQYYEYRGWDIRTSLQTNAKLEQLEMADVARVLESEGSLA